MLAKWGFTNLDGIQRLLSWSPTENVCADLVPSKLQIKWSNLMAFTLFLALSFWQRLDVWYHFCKWVLNIQFPKAKVLISFDRNVAPEIHNIGQNFCNNLHHCFYSTLELSSDFHSMTQSPLLILVSPCNGTYVTMSAHYFSHIQTLSGDWLFGFYLGK